MFSLKNLHFFNLLLFTGLISGIPSPLPATETPGSFTFSTETKKPDTSREALDTAPKYNPESGFRGTTKEEAGNYKKRDILTRRYHSEAVAGAMADAGPFRPFPPAGDPAYQALPADERAAILAEAETLLGYDWPTLTATRFLDFYETGSQEAYLKAYMERLKSLEVLLYAEILEGEGRFVRDIANGIWVLCEQTIWALPSHLNVEFPGAGMPSIKKPILALLGSEVGALMATAEYFLAEELDALNPVFRERMHYEVNRQMLDPYLNRTDYWWMAYEKPFTNNWSPWITSNVLLCTLVFESSPERRVDLVMKALDVLDRFINVYPDDGGCEEGPAYWDHAGGRLLDCLRLLRQSTGGLVDIFDVELIREMGNFMIYASIDPPWYVNFADAFARYTPRSGTLFRYGMAVGSENLMSFAARFPFKPYMSTSRVEQVFLRQLPDLFIRHEIEAWDRPFEPLAFKALHDMETVYIRQSTDTDSGFYLAAKGGYNAESHNHNDVGNFIVFLDGEPLLIDTGVGTYTSKTFSQQRYEIWAMQSSYHNLPDINGEAQPHMLQWQADFFQTVNTPEKALVQMGLASAYPDPANLEAYTRTLEFNRESETVTLQEVLDFRDSRAANGGNRIDFHLMTHHTPTRGDVPGSILLAHPETGDNRAVIDYPAHLDVLVTKIELEDPRMAASWGDTLYRITLSTRLSPETSQGAYKFLIRRN